MQVSFDKELILLCKVIGIYNCSCSCNWYGKFGCSVIVYCYYRDDHHLGMGHLCWHWRVLPAPLNRDENIHRIAQGNYDDSEHVRGQGRSLSPRKFSLNCDAFNAVDSKIVLECLSTLSGFMSHLSHRPHTIILPWNPIFPPFHASTSKSAMEKIGGSLRRFIWSPHFYYAFILYSFHKSRLSQLGLSHLVIHFLSPILTVLV